MPNKARNNDKIWGQKWQDQESSDGKESKDE